MAEIKEQYAKASVAKESLLQFKPATLANVQSEQEILRLAPVPIYAVDPLVRNAKSLQETVLAQSDKIWMNDQTAAEHDVKENDRIRIQQDGVISEPLTVQFSAGLPDKTILVHSAIQATSQLGAGYNFVKILSEKG
jgi:NADH-quinone oxidoreductase subunit G